MEIFTYLIRSVKDNSFYTGISENPEKRLQEHNRGKLRITALKRPWELIYKKTHLSYSEARKHEKWLKKKNRNYKNNLKTGV